MVEKILALNSRSAFKSEYGDAKKYVDFLAIEEMGMIAEDIQVQAIINEKKLEADRLLLGYNLLIPSETTMKAEQIYKTYHALWRIEETFRILKSNLETRPVYVKNKNSIYGHFLANYLAVFFLRILQIKVFNEEFTVNDIIKFIKNLRVTKVGNEYLNLFRCSVVEPLANYLKIDVLGRKLSPRTINNLMKKKI